MSADAGATIKVDQGETVVAVSEDANIAPEDVEAVQEAADTLLLTTTDNGNGTTTYKAATKYTLTFNANGGTGTMAAQVIGGTAALNANAFTREGFTFNGWNTKADGTGTAYADKTSITPAADMTLYAQWKAVPKDDTTDAAVEAVKAKINALPASDKVATSDKAAIEAARKAYNALTADQKSKSADGYFVYAQYCGKKMTKPVKTIKKNSVTKTTITKIGGKKISTKKQFKVYVAPYKIVNGKKVKLGKSMTAHMVGAKNKKYSNVKKLTIKKKKYTVKVGKTKKIKAKVTLVKKNRKHIPEGHGTKFRYKSSNKKIATVTKKGKIKGKKKGKCTIYVYAINGITKKIKVKVK